MILGPSVNQCPHCGSTHPAGLAACPRTEGSPAPAAGRTKVAPRVTIPARIMKAPARTLVGRVIGDKYGVVSLIGQGGMGSVYEAEHLSLGRIVAVKVLHPAQAQKPEAVRRLEHEARVVAAIGHPNICEIYDMGRLDDGTPYLVMERLRGKTLADRIRDFGRIPYREVLDVAVQILSALDAAHRLGVIHRDMKPENIFLVDQAGRPPLAKLLDFGVSKAEHLEQSQLRMTRTGMVVGTPYYMAPEQALGERTLDQRVDLWGVGMVLFEALTGARPFEGKNYNALLARIVTTPHPAVQKGAPDLPPSFALIVDRALEKDREHRYQTARELQEALLAFRRFEDAASEEGDPRHVTSTASGGDFEEELSNAHLSVEGLALHPATVHEAPRFAPEVGSDDDDWDARTRVRRPADPVFSPVVVLPRMPLDSAKRIVEEPTIDVTAEAEILPGPAVASARPRPRLPSLAEPLIAQAMAAPPVSVEVADSDGDVVEVEPDLDFDAEPGLGGAAPSAAPWPEAPSAEERAPHESEPAGEEPGLFDDFETTIVDPPRFDWDDSSSVTTFRPLPSSQAPGEEGRPPIAPAHVPAAPSREERQAGGPDVAGSKGAPRGGRS